MNLITGAAAGAITPSHLALPHNEHHVLTSRIISFTLMLLSGYWDIAGELIVSAAVRAAELALITALLWPLLSGGGRMGLVALVLAMGAMPISPFNLLAGFQVQFALAETFSFDGPGFSRGSAARRREPVRGQSVLGALILAAGAIRFERRA